jgi:hypothetical protein
MRPKKYPLEPLRRLKKERAEQKTRELGTAIAARETVQRRREEAEGEQKAARARAEAVREEERSALVKGELFARDLARGGAWEQRVSAEDQERARGVEKARTREDDARRLEARAQGDVAIARAEVEVTARHEERWTSAARKVAESSEEEALAEAVPAKGPAPSRGARKRAR